MRQLALIAWKEWRELRWLMLAGLLVVFWITRNTPGSNYPQLGAHQIWQLAMVSGPVLAIFLAVAVVAHDVQRPVYAFWQSCPIRSFMPLLVKYLFGIVLLMLVVDLPFFVVLIRDLADFMPWRSVLGRCALFTAVYSPAWIAQFSAAFFIACLVRRPVNAALLAAAAVGVIACLPLVFPPLGWLDGSALIERFSWRYTGGDVPFWITSLRPVWITWLTFSVMMVGGACLVIARDYRLRLDQRSLCGVLALTALVLFGMAGWQLGNNMMVERKIALGTGQVFGAVTYDQRALLLMQDPPAFNAQTPMVMRMLDLGHPDATALDRKAIPIGQRGNLVSGHSRRVCWDGGHYAYVLQFTMKPAIRPFEYAVDTLSLRTVSVPRAGDTEEPLRVVHELDLWDAAGRPSIAPGILHEGHRLFIISWPVRSSGSQVVAIDLDDPAAPQIAQTQRLSGVLGVDLEEDGSRLRLNLQPELSLPPYAQLDMGINTLGGWHREGDLLILASASVKTFVLQREARRIEGTMLGEREPTALEIAFAARSGESFFRAGLLYAAEGTFGYGLTVYDLRDPTVPRRMSHFAAPADLLLAIATLPEGRTLVAGKNIYVVAPPRGR